MQSKTNLRGRAVHPMLVAFPIALVATTLVSLLALFSARIVEPDTLLGLVLTGCGLGLTLLAAIAGWHLVHTDRVLAVASADRR